MREDSLSPGEFHFALLGLSLMFVYAAGAALAGWYFLEFVKHMYTETTYVHFNSLGPKFSSQGHFHSLQLLNVPQFLFSRLVRLKTAPKGNFSHA